LATHHLKGLGFAPQIMVNGGYGHSRARPGRFIRPSCCGPVRPSAAHRIGKAWLSWVGPSLGFGTWVGPGQGPAERAASFRPRSLAGAGHSAPTVFAPHRGPGCPPVGGGRVFPPSWAGVSPGPRAGVFRALGPLGPRIWWLFSGLGRGDECPRFRRPCWPLATTNILPTNWLLKPSHFRGARRQARPGELFGGAGFKLPGVCGSVGRWLVAPENSFPLPPERTPPGGMDGLRAPRLPWEARGKRRLAGVARHACAGIGGGFPVFGTTISVPWPPVRQLRLFPPYAQARPRYTHPRGGAGIEERAPYWRPAALVRGVFELTWVRNAAFACCPFEGVGPVL